MVNRIYIMRHGHSVVNLARRLACREREGELTALGNQQAARAATWFADKGVTRIVSSPFERARQTAEIAAARLGVPMQLDERLVEMDCGDLEGRTDDEAWAQWLAVYHWQQAIGWEAGYRDGESYGQALERLRSVLNDIQADETALLVSHGGLIGCVLPYLCVNAAALQNLCMLDNTGLVVLEPYDAGRYICRAWNLVEHLNGG